MMWDPSRDPKALMTEFLNGYYGAAAPYLQQYIDLLDEIINRDGGRFLSCYLTSTEGWLGFDDLCKATELFNQAAEGVAGDETMTQRVRRAGYSIDVVWLERYHEFQKEARERQLPLLGPDDPNAWLDELDQIQGEVGHYREGREFPEYLDKLKALFAED